MLLGRWSCSCSLTCAVTRSSFSLSCLPFAGAAGDVGDGQFRICLVIVVGFRMPFIHSWCQMFQYVICAPRIVYRGLLHLYRSTDAHLLQKYGNIPPRAASDSTEQTLRTCWQRFVCPADVLHLSVRCTLCSSCIDCEGTTRGSGSAPVYTYSH